MNLFINWFYSSEGPWWPREPYVNNEQNNWVQIRAHKKVMGVKEQVKRRRVVVGDGFGLLYRRRKSLLRKGDGRDDQKILGKITSISGSSISGGKGPKARVSLSCSGNTKRAGVAGMESPMDWGIGNMWVAVIQKHTFRDHREPHCGGHQWCACHCAFGKLILSSEQRVDLSWPRQQQRYVPGSLVH